MSRSSPRIVSMEWTRAGRGHYCRHNKKHLIQRGDRRLTIKSYGDEHHYCESCAKLFLPADIKRLQEVLSQADD